MPFYVYILYSQKLDKFYIGHTNNIDRRIIEHDNRENLGTNDWVLKYSEQFLTRSLAMKRESEIKRKKRRTYLEWLINNKPD
ncbi:MAG: GIY-YIG nuclease family protein [Bacteroidia bacterium]